ncbi:MAG: prepilin-type N-terminal cleavage/methylation domain-containing protein [Planctomycetes bacterium]|nr:prepilin-type N-terminal cleavage/methylation domain-containing protein [Planctomycetota bacterium]
MTLRSAPIQQCPANPLPLPGEGRVRGVCPHAVDCVHPHPNPRPQGGRGLPRRCAFTLVELLVVMGVIAVLATLTLVSVRAITDNARLSSATNTVMAALDNARALAMKKNTIVLVVFRPRFEGNNKQVVEIVTARWSGEAPTAWVSYSPPLLQVVDRFVPIPDVPVRALPPGTKVAGPSYGAGEDLVWVTQSHLPAIDQSSGLGEVRGQLIAVMYSADGTTLTRNSQTDSARTFVDFNNDGIQDVAGSSIDYNIIPPPTIAVSDFNEAYFDHRFENEETYVSVVPFVAVYDDDQARETYGDDDWNDPQQYLGELTNNDPNNPPLGYIAQFADRIHFNRYTGVAMK